MSQKDPTHALQNRIKELELELTDRERDLSVFRAELSKANQQLEKLIQQIGSELKMAGQIQKALVPTEFPNIPGFEFSTKFIPSPIQGGDYFDIFEHEDKLRFGIVLANSSGYSMSALFLSVLLKMTGQLEARRGGPPDKMIEMMARELVPYVQNSDRANIFYGVIDRRTYDLKYCHVGQNICLHLSASSGKLQRLENITPPLQAGFNIPLTTQTLSLQPRDRLIFCTEGAVRAKNLKGESFGEERLYRSILASPRAGVHDLRNELFYQIEKFSTSVDLPQDVTIIVTEVKDRVIKLA